MPLNLTKLNIMSGANIENLTVLEPLFKLSLLVAETAHMIQEMKENKIIPDLIAKNWLNHF